MTRTSKIIGISAILLAGLTTAAFAQGPGGMGHKGFKNGLPPIPDLTQEQKQKITDLKTTAMQQSAPLHEQMVAIHKQIRALWTADTLDRTAITTKEAEAGGLMQKVKGIWTDFFFQLHDVLTPAQRTWLAQHGPGKGGHFGGPGMGPGMGMGADNVCPCATPQP